MLFIYVFSVRLKKNTDLCVHSKALKSCSSVKTESDFISIMNRKTHPGTHLLFWPFLFSAYGCSLFRKKIRKKMTTECYHGDDHSRLSQRPCWGPHHLHGTAFASVVFLYISVTWRGWLKLWITSGFPAITLRAPCEDITFSTYYWSFNSVFHGLSPWPA